MKNKTLFLLTSLCAVTLLTSACTQCPQQTHGNQHEHQYKDKDHKKHKYDVNKVKANMMTRSSSGGQSEMGTIWFTETPEGLKMTVDLVYLRPNKTYIAEIYQCDACGNDTCCAAEAMSIDLPEFKVTNNDERLKQTHMVHGATAEQLNNAKLILRRDGGYKAAWGTLKQK